MNPSKILGASVTSLLDERTLLLVAIVSLILILSSSMERLGQMEELLWRFRKWVAGRRWGLVAFPALIGFLPMPGGAVFSAPMLEAFDTENRVSPAMKSFLNHWFRHIWEYWWPLFPGVLLTCSIADLDLGRFIILAFPLTSVAILGGAFHLLRIPRNLEARPQDGEPMNDHGGWRPIFPILLAILPGVGFTLLLQFWGRHSVLGTWPKEVWLIIGLLVAVLWTWWNRRAGKRQIQMILQDPKLARMWLTVAGAFVFKGVLEESGAAEVVSKMLLHLEIPLEWAAVLLPLTIGGITGWTVAYVGTCFPILVALIHSFGAMELKLPLMVLAFASGFTGALISPLHLCLVLSNEYFRTSWLAVFRYLWFPALLLLGGVIGYFWLLKGALS